MQLLTDEPDGFSFVPDHDEGGGCFGMIETVSDIKRSRRKADKEAYSAAHAAFADGGGGGSWMDRPMRWCAALMRRVKARQPADIRATLAAPLFDRTSSLIMAHGGATVIAAIANQTSHAWWPRWLLGINIGVWVLRVLHLHATDRKRAQIGAQAVLNNLPVYQGLGLIWASVNGMFVVLSMQPDCPPQLHALTFAFSLGICSGIAARCASTPIYAIVQIMMWMVPGAIQDAFIGGWSLLLSGLIVAYVVALISVIGRLHGDLVTLICVQRRSSAMASRFDAALSNMSQGLILYDADGTLRVVNRRFYKLFALRAGALSEGDDAGDVVRACVEGGLLQLAHAAELTMAPQGEAGRSACVLELTNGRSIEVSSDLLSDGSKISTYEDITERRANEARIAHMALHDGLTNMPNRLLFRDRLDQSVAWLGRGEGFAIACLDLDHFKEVNDTLGHNMGDRLLQEVATRLTCCLREVDLVARLGGDEFAVLLPGINEPDEAQVVARRLIDTVSGRYDIEGASMTIGVSIGVALAPRDGADAETLLMHADLAMYAAKADGRGGSRLFERDLSTRLAARQDLERDFRAALEREEFVMHYQPTVNLAQGRIASFEALIRWNHPERGLVGPDQFIPFAEESGLIIPLGTWVLDTACRQAAAWPSSIGVAVNLSPVQFRSGTLLQDVLGALERSGLPPTRLEVEITEAAILGETEATLAALRHLRALGVRVAFDDFGTGFSSLSYLHRFVFDKIKIDKSFIHDLETSESAAAIVRAITGLGQNLNLMTTAEGVETVSQLKWLRQLGCSEVQGYLFSRPRPYHEVAELLAGSDTILARVQNA